MNFNQARMTPKDIKSWLVNAVNNKFDIPRLNFQLSLPWWTEDRYDKVIEILKKDWYLDDILTK